METNPQKLPENNVQVMVLNLPEPRSPERSNPDTPPITTDPEKLGGTPTIAGYRVPVTALIDFIAERSVVADFAAEYEIPAGDVEAALMKIREALENGWLAERVNGAKSEEPEDPDALSRAVAAMINRTPEQIKAAQERAIRELQPERELPPGKSIFDVVKWPGDETDEEVFAALERLS